MQIGLLEKVFLFFSKLAKRWEQLSCLVKKTHLFQKLKCSNVFIFMISKKFRPLTIQISTF